MPFINLTQTATAAAQFLGVLDSGESLSTQQLTDALAVANNLLESWYQEQNLALQELAVEQAKALATLVAQQTQAAAPLITAYTILGGTYNAAGINPPSVTPGTMPQFPDTTTAISLPNGYDRALKLGVALEIAPQYDVEPTQALLKAYTEARAAANPMPGKVPIPGLSVQSEVPQGAQ